MKHALLLLALVGACTDPDPGDPGIEATSHVEFGDFPEAPPNKLDLLVIIDDTPAMAAYQQRIAMLPAQLAAASQLADTHFDLRIAVTTSTGIRRTASSIGGSFITIYPGYDLSNVTNLTGTFDAALGALSAVGADNPEPNRPFETLVHTLEDHSDGFRRENAPMGVVIISASDDASPGDAAQLARTAKSMFADPNNLFVASITRPPSSRFDEFLAEFPNRHLSVSIDEANWAPAFDAFAQLSRTIIPAICWHASDVDLETPGPQYDCTFTATVQGNQWRLPPCVFPGDQFCWMLRPQMNCFPDSGLDTEFPPWGDFVFRPAIHAECVVLE